MEPKIWIYIVVILIYVVRWAMKKASQNANDSPDSQRSRPPRREVPGTSGDKARPLTFEELLKEITENKKVTQPQPTYVDYDENIQEEIKSSEVTPRSYETPQRVYREYETSKKEAFVRPSLEETLKLEDTDVRFGKFKAFTVEEERNVRLEEYIQDFQDPEGLKKALVMSEILKTKF